MLEFNTLKFVIDRRLPLVIFRKQPTLLMQDQAFTILEYPELRALIRRGAQTPMGRVRVEALRPLENFAELRTQLAALAEAVALRKRGAA